MEKEEFKILSLREENNLTIGQKLRYYEELRKYLKKRKLTNTTLGATTVAPKLKNLTNKIAINLTNVLAGSRVEYISDGQEFVPDTAVIYAHTHQGLLDNFSWIPATKQHSIIFHSEVVKKFLILAQLNTGLILVNKEDKKSRKNSKLDMMKLLLDGHSIAIFPESAWNLSPNKLHLPMNYGFIDVARKTGAPIIPVVDEYTYDSSSPKEKITKIHIRFGKPIYVSEKDDIREKFQEYLEAISTIRFELIEEKGLFKRNEINDNEYTNYLIGNINNLKMGGIDINVERKNLWDSNNEFYKFFHINDILMDSNGNLIETPETTKIKELNKKHHI